MKSPGRGTRPGLIALKTAGKGEGVQAEMAIPTGGISA